MIITVFSDSHISDWERMIKCDYSHTVLTFDVDVPVEVHPYYNHYFWFNEYVALFDPRMLAIGGFNEWLAERADPFADDI